MLSYLNYFLHDVSSDFGTASLTTGRKKTSPNMTFDRLSLWLRRLGEKSQALCPDPPGPERALARRAKPLDLNYSLLSQTVLKYSN